MKQPNGGLFNVCDHMVMHLSARMLHPGAQAQLCTSHKVVHVTHKVVHVTHKVVHVTQSRQAH